MPARDIYHDAVRNALIKDGWTITHDPYRLSYGQVDVYVDIGAEQLLAAERGMAKIALEIKTFQGPSSIRDFYQALGQYNFYTTLLETVDSTRVLYLAVSARVYESAFEAPAIRKNVERFSVKLMTFDPQLEVIREWKP